MAENRYRHMLRFLEVMAPDGIEIVASGSGYSIIIIGQRLYGFDTHAAAVDWLAYTLSVNR
jgi:hypothetical protein